MKIRPTLQPAVTFLIAMTGIALLLSACAWSVPADPGLNAKLHGTPPAAGAAGPLAAAASGADTVTAAAAHDAAARSLYLNHCSRCHEPIAPGAVAASDWPRYVRRYGPRAGLFGADRTRVLRWLQANAR